MAKTMRGKVVMITGAAGNLGRAVVAHYAEQGAKLVLLDRAQEPLDALAAGLSGSPMTAALDLTDAAAVEALILRVQRRVHRVDVLVHTVGGFEMGTAVHESGPDVLDRMMNINVRPLWVLGGRVAQHMIEYRIPGHIVFVLARSGLKGGAKMAAYTAAKAAAQRIMESMALELRDHDIHVNGVLPSTIDTPANRASMPNADPARWVTPAQVADAIAFLASDAASALYGVSLEVYNRA
jgi:NAD(P)-dependent dehydrogenase (short-subunit alcohol dehydrogenase family)